MGDAGDGSSWVGREELIKPPASTINKINVSVLRIRKGYSMKLGYLN
jgi:hypothetical protein